MPCGFGWLKDACTRPCTYIVRTIIALLQIPLMVSEISNENHPVVVGLSDSFYVDRTVEGSGGPR